MSCPFGALFDGTNDFMSRVAMVGAADSSQGVISFWVRMNAAAGAAQAIIRYSSNRLNFFRNTTDTLSCILQNSAGTITFQVTSTSTVPTGATWHHVLYSYDTNFSAGNKIGKMYIDDVDVSSVTADAGAAFNVANVSALGIGATTGGASKLNADLAEVWYAQGTFIDLTVTANRRLFVTADVKWVGLGAAGERPTGISPILYCKGPAASMPTNLGTGGPFAVTGALTDSATRLPCADFQSTRLLMPAMQVNP